MEDNNVAILLADLLSQFWTFSESLYGLQKKVYNAPNG